ncbi:MAG: hypothetical protein AB8G99_11615 [Planctomycetaceae bacterium]
MRFSYFLVIIAALETSQFYQLHWGHRHLFPKRFRALLMSKGLLKAIAYIAIGLAIYRFSVPFAWVYAIGHPILGVLLHVRSCRANGIDPIRVEPRERYVKLTADWVNRLVERQQAGKSKP